MKLVSSRISDNPHSQGTNDLMEYENSVNHILWQSPEVFKDLEPMC